MIFFILYYFICFLCPALDPRTVTHVNSYFDLLLLFSIIKCYIKWSCNVAFLELRKMHDDCYINFSLCLI